MAEMLQSCDGAGFHESLFMCAFAAGLWMTAKEIFLRVPEKLPAAATVLDAIYELEMRLDLRLHGRVQQRRRDWRSSAKIPKIPLDKWTLVTYVSRSF
jgi:hypothetical protein